MITQLFKGIWRISLPYFQDSVNVFLVEGEKPILIDSGPPYEEARQELLQALQKIGYEWEDLARVILTHEHIDHSGGVSFMGDGPKVFARKGIESLLKNYDQFMEEHLQLGFKLAKIYPELGFLTSSKSLQEISAICLKGGKIKQLYELADGEIVDSGKRKLQVIYTNGHGRYHLCLFDLTDKVLFSGDYILPSGPALTRLMGDSIDAFNKSIERIEALSINTIEPSHGITLEAEKGLQHIKHFVENQENKLLTALQVRPRTLAELVDVYYGNYKGRGQVFLYGGLDTFLQRLLEKDRISINNGYVYNLALPRANSSE